VTGGKMTKKKKSDEETLDKEMMELLPAEGEVFGLVLEPLGAGRMRVECSDGEVRVCRIRGKLKGRRSWISRRYRSCFCVGFSA